MQGAQQAAQALNPLVLVLTSAGIAAFVTSVITLFGQWLERRSRRRELLLAKAIDLASMKTELAIRTADKSGAQVELIDAVYLAEKYYRYMNTLLDSGSLPADAHEKLRSSRKRNTVRESE